MSVTRHLALGLALVLVLGPASARDWRWYPKRQSPDANALRPDLEGAKGDDGNSGLTELDEMRQWLYRRDVERRERGFTVPDTVEQIDPTVSEPPPLPPPRHWTRPGFGSPSVGGFDSDGGSRERIRSMLPVEPVPQAPREGLTDPTEVPMAEGFDGADAAPEQHTRSGKHHYRSKSGHRKHHRSGKSSKSRSGKHRHR
ncbi:hypothetical protein ACW73L_08495 [Methylolobus aquaticus]|nr:hypothetical protein EWI61_05900 [Methylolobus aquaticus]